jgi:hypothetical protein
MKTVTVAELDQLERLDATNGNYITPGMVDRMARAVAELRALRTPPAPAPCASCEALRLKLADLCAAAENINNDYRPTCERASYGSGCPGADAESVAFWRAAVEVVEQAAAAPAASEPGLPTCTSCLEPLTDGGVKDGNEHLCLRCGGERGDEMADDETAERIAAWIEVGAANLDGTAIGGALTEMVAAIRAGAWRQP